MEKEERREDLIVQYIHTLIELCSRPVGSRPPKHIYGQVQVLSVPIPPSAHLLSSFYTSFDGSWSNGKQGSPPKNR